VVKTVSTMLPLGTPLPFFELAKVPGTGMDIADNSKGSVGLVNSRMFESRPLLIMILCSHCPFVKHVEGELTKLNQDYYHQIDFLGVASNSFITHPQDAPENLLAQSKKNGWRFPYLLDLEQSFAKALKAACTPDFFLFSPWNNGVQELLYRGQLDGSRPDNNIPLNSLDLRLAINAVLKNEKVSDHQKPSIGCNIKWHPEREPSWFG